MCDGDGAQRFAARFRITTPRVKHDIRPHQRICIELNFVIALPLCFDLGKRPKSTHTWQTPAATHRKNPSFGPEDQSKDRTMI